MHDDQMEEPRRYYDFSFLLKPAPKLVNEEQKELLAELVQAEQAGRDIVIGCALNAFVIEGDLMYERDEFQKQYVATESSITSAVKEMRETKQTLDLVGSIKKRLGSWPACATHYQSLFDFEMFLLREQKKRRLTSKREPL